MNRAARFVAAVAVIAAAYGAGVGTGALAGMGARPTAAGSGGSVLDQAERDIASGSATRVSGKTLQRAAIQGMLRSLGDPWAAYYAAPDFAGYQQALSGDYTGVGIWIRRTTSGTVRVTHVTDGSPAAVAGLHAGDVVLSVGGQSTAGRTVAEVVSRLRGRPGSDIAMLVRRGPRELDVEVRRSAISDDDVQASMLTPSVESLRVRAFTRGVGRWVQKQTHDATQRHLQGLVLDLRDDPGGLLDEAVSVASAFLTSGPVVSYQRRGQATVTLDATGGGNDSIPLVVLVDGGTASAAEIVTGALQDRGRAIVVGSQTFGKGSVQVPDKLSDGAAIELTVGRYLTPLHRSLDGVGITPDVVVPVGTSELVEQQRAIEVLSGLTADTGNPGQG